VEAGRCGGVGGIQPFLRLEELGVLEFVATVAIALSASGLWC